MTVKKNKSWMASSLMTAMLVGVLTSVLGQTLTTLEELKPQANEGQRMAIDNARPHLAAMAEELTQALNLLSDDRKSVYRSPYTDTVSNLYNHAESLYETVDTIMDNEKSRSRLSNLDVMTSAEGS